MRIFTAIEERAQGTDNDLAPALESVQRGPGEFLRVERGGGEGELQMLPIPIELLRGGRIYRPSTVPGVLELFRAFAAGRPGWDAGIEWIDVTKEVRGKQRTAKWQTIGAIALVVAAVAVWFVFRKR